LDPHTRMSATVVSMVWTLLIGAIFAGCSRGTAALPRQEPSETGTSAFGLDRPISEERAREIAIRDAEKSYGDLSNFIVRTKLGEQGWHVDFIYAYAQGLGGDISYVIDTRTGEIVSKEHSQ